MLSSLSFVLLVLVLLGTTILPPIASRLEEGGCVSGNLQIVDFVPSRVASSFYDLSADTITGEKMSMSTLSGKVVLIVNVASFW
jgi:hypothetical protein